MTLTAQQKYRQTDKGKAKDKRYSQSEKGRITHNKGQKKYWQSEKGQEYKEIHLEESKEYGRNYPYTSEGKIAREKYITSEKGKMCDRRHRAKRRNLGFNKLIENKWDCKVDWHHVNDNDVVPIPRNLHKLCYTGDSKKHREMCNRLINILYEGELKV